MKLMYWPNEGIFGSRQVLQVGPRAAFEQQLNRGEIGALDIYSYLAEWQTRANENEYVKSTLERIADFAPDILLVQHVTDFNVGRDFWQKVRGAAPNVTIVYHEADPYGLLFKRLTGGMHALLSQADLTLLSGLGRHAARFRRATKGLVAYLPQFYDTQRFGSLDWDPATSRLDVVMIGNCGAMRRVPGMYLPGGHRRKLLADRLAARYGDRFALYGSGWHGNSSARGPLDYSEQERVIQSARLSVNWDHFDRIPFYFSDRLPISLAAGVPHITSYHFGYKQILSGCPGLYWGGTVSEVVDCIDWMLSRSNKELKQEGSAARAWAAQRLEASVIFKRALDLSTAVHLRKRANRP